MNNKKYTKLSANNIAVIKQSYYNQMFDIKTLMESYKSKSCIANTTVFDIDEELKYINIAIKNTLLQIKLLNDNLDINEDKVNHLKENINNNKYNSKDKIDDLNYKISELTKMKNELISLQQRKKELKKRKKELIQKRKKEKYNIKAINKNIKICRQNLNIIDATLLYIEDTSIIFNGYVENNKIQPKLKEMKKLK